MELKDYQIKVLDYLESYLADLKTQKAEKQDYFEFLKQKGKEAVLTIRIIPVCLKM